jgi:photosystem II stability/assembly factor-like uncharacterized protein
MNRPLRFPTLLLLASLPLLAGATRSAGQTAGGLPEPWTRALRWRSIGPATMAGRITALSVYDADPTTYWVATASGGLLKTTNNGVTFEHQFEREATVSIGDVKVAPSNPNVVWLGTGEGNPRNSVSYGDGVYRSTDGGKTWRNVGLRESYQTGRLAVHPANPEVCYVGALGRLYGPNKERGVFKTTDGGRTWEKVLFVDDRTGVIDLVMHPTDPETLIAATWERRRDGFDSWPGDEAPPGEGYDTYDPVKKWSKSTGLWKTTDGGRNWKRLTRGLPTNEMGRIGLCYYQKNPNTLFAIIDCAKIGMGTPPRNVFMGILGQTAEGGARLTQVTENGPAAKGGLRPGDLITHADGRTVTYETLVTLIRTKKAGDRVLLTVRREAETLELTVTLEERQQPERAATLAQLLGALTADAEGGGVTLTRVGARGPAENADLVEGDVILAADGRRVNSAQLLALLQGKRPGDRVRLTVRAGEKERSVDLRLPEGTVSGVQGQSRLRPYTYMYAGQQPNVQDQQGPDAHEYGGVYRSDDGGESWTRVNSLNPRPMYFSKIRVDPSDDRHVYVLGVNLYHSSDGGKTFRSNAGQRAHADHHAMWINPRDGRHLVLGTDGGFYVSYDRTQTWDHLNHAAALGQFYHVAVDTRTPYRVYGGLQDNGSWGGPSMTLTAAGPINEHWLSVGGGDGFVCRVEASDPDWVYWESQNGNIARRNLKTGERATIRPARERGKRYRFNWNTPFFLSHHNPRILYSAGNYVFRSLNRGENLRVVSPELTRTPHGTATALAESPRNPDVLWAGTDDGNLWITRDGGANWSNVAAKVGLPGPRWVATIEASRTVEGRAYVAFDAHRSDDDDPYVYVTEDFGQTWKSLRANLPIGSTRCLREDPVNPNLLLLGTEFAVFASINRGENWTRINNNLPTVAVHELAIHPTAGEVVAATHGRSLWILDLTTLRQITPAVTGEAVRLFAPRKVVRWRSELAPSTTNGHRRFVGENPYRGAQIAFALAQKAGALKLAVFDAAGTLVREVAVRNEPGLQVAQWDLTRAPRAAAGARPGGGAGGGGGMGGGGGQFGLPVPNGPYRVVLTVDGKEYAQPLVIEADPVLGDQQASPEVEDADAEFERERARRRRGLPTPDD